MATGDPEDVYFVFVLSQGLFLPELANTNKKVLPEPDLALSSPSTSPHPQTSCLAPSLRSPTLTGMAPHCPDNDRVKLGHKRSYKHPRIGS
jgi:hypothetical protein